MKYFTLFILSTFFSYLLVLYTKYLSHRYRILAQPQLNRWHNKPIPIHGSFGFFIIFVFFVFFTISIYAPDIRNISETSEVLITQSVFKSITFVVALIGSAIMLFILGFVDDLFSLKASTKIIIQILICTFFILDTEVFYISDNSLLNFSLTLLWLVGILNAANLIDSFDGICASTIVVTSLSLLFITLISSTSDNNSFYMLAIASILSGSVMGFLIHNYPPASIFMGDSGSLSLGFIIAAISIPSEANNFLGLGNNISSVKILLPICILSYPIFDTTLVTFSRILNKKKFYLGGKDHTTHRLANMGYSDSQVLFICLIYSLIGILSGLMIYNYQEYSILIFLLFFSLNFLGFLYMLKTDLIQLFNKQSKGGVKS